MHQAEVADPLRHLRAHLSACAAVESNGLDRLSHHLTRYLRFKAARKDIIGEGDCPHSVILMLEGWACRYKELADGRRQIVSFLIPGDIGYADIALFERMDHSVGTITAARYVHLPAAKFAELVGQRDSLSLALRRQELVSVCTAHEWTTNIGQRRAPERLAHLLCELFLRLRAVGLTDGHQCVLPLTQADLANATGLTEIHVNRSLQDLRRRNLVRFHDKVLTIPDFNSVAAACMFSDTYLHLPE